MLAILRQTAPISWRFFLVFWPFPFHLPALHFHWSIAIVLLDLDVLQRVSCLTDLGGDSTDGRGGLGLGALLGGLCLLRRSRVLGELLGEGNEVGSTGVVSKKSLELYFKERHDLPRQVLAQGLRHANTLRCLEVLEDGAWIILACCIPSVSHTLCHLFPHVLVRRLTHGAAGGGQGGVQARARLEYCHHHVIMNIIGYPPTSGRISS